MVVKPLVDVVLAWNSTPRRPLVAVLSVLSAFSPSLNVMIRRVCHGGVPLAGLSMSLVRKSVAFHVGVESWVRFVLLIWYALTSPDQSLELYDD